MNVAAVFVFVAAFFVFFILLPDPAAASFDQSRDVSLLPYLGKFEYNQHNVKGHVYQIDDRSVFVHRFHYDGDGPDDEYGNPGGISFLAVPSGVHNYSHGVPMDIWDGGIRFEPGHNFNSHNTIVIDNYDDERLFLDPSVDPLRRIQGTLQEVSRPIRNENITLVLPNRNLNVDHIGRIVFWCKIYGVSFGRVDADEARGFKLPDRPILDLQYAGPFVDTEHSVGGDVYIRDSETLVIRDFSFDGRGPPAHFLAGESNDLDSGVQIAFPYKKRISRVFGPDRLKASDRRDIVVRLPSKLDAYRIKWLSVWCDTYDVSFGHVQF